MRGQLDRRIQEGLNSTFYERESTLTRQTINQLEEYFKNEREDFDIPLRLVGTAFQKKVWKKLLKIPFGQTRSYTELSELLGDKKAIRAVASANGANTISIIVPCHRIIASDGSLQGYAGGLPAKKNLLKHEGSLPGKDQLELF